MMVALHPIALAALFAVNLEVSVKNTDSVGHKVTVEVQKRTGAVHRSVSTWLNSGDETTFKKIRGLVHGQRYHVYFDTSIGRTVACEGWIDQVRDSELCVIRGRPRVVNEHPIDSLLGIAQMLEIDSKAENDVMSLSDLLPRLGAVIVATKKDDGSYEHHAIVKFEDVQISRVNDRTLHTNTVTNRSALVALEANPLFVRLNIAASYAEYYSLWFDLAQGFYVSNFEVQKALIGADLGAIEAIRNSLMGNPNAEVYFIERFNTIENAVLTVTESREITEEAQAHAGVFVRADGKYVFDHRNEKIVQIRSVVVSTTPARVATRAFMLAYLTSRLKGERHLDLGENTVFASDRDAFMKGLDVPEIHMDLQYPSDEGRRDQARPGH